MDAAAPGMAEIIVTVMAVPFLETDCSIPEEENKDLAIS